MRTLQITWIDTRRMTYGMVDYKRDQILEQLAPWCLPYRFQLKELAELLGTLVDMALTCRWGMTVFFALQNCFRSILTRRYHQVKNWYARSGRAARIADTIPAALAPRIESLMSRDMAQVLWRDNHQYSVPSDAQAEIQYLCDYLADRSNPWETLIGHVVPRVPTFYSRGDASKRGGGALSDSLRYWFDFHWNDSIIRGINLPPATLHTCI